MCALSVYCCYLFSFVVTFFCPSHTCPKRFVVSKTRRVARLVSGGGRRAGAAGSAGEGTAPAPPADKLPPRGGDARGPVPADRRLGEARLYGGHKNVPHPARRRGEVQVSTPIHTCISA